MGELAVQNVPIVVLLAVGSPPWLAANDVHTCPVTSLLSAWPHGSSNKSTQWQGSLQHVPFSKDGGHHCYALSSPWLQARLNPLLPCDTTDSNNGYYQSWSVADFSKSSDSQLSRHNLNAVVFNMGAFVRLHHIACVIVWSTQFMEILRESSWTQ